MKFRHEWKHEINYSDFLAIKQNLSAVASIDSHARDGTYEIRSLYFDNIYDKALREKIDGINCREKFRIRYYNGDLSIINLEKKSKINGLCNKVSAPLLSFQAQSIVDGNTDWMINSDYPLIRELYAKMQSQLLRPQTIVDYTRIPFVYAPGNVRVTLDFNIRTGLRCVDFLNQDAVTLPAGDSPIILEVKWDEFLPENIRHACELHNRHSAAFSKYAACRIYD
ncbi:MAG: polyphosphate polymerase domain-containing protein [Oscillospiraceae bacterium]|nr:polyphosphate polymerase domain-containing protein [Oscillospiraceae bacterium]